MNAPIWLIQDKGGHVNGGNKSCDGLTGKLLRKMAVDTSVITEVARQASSFDFANLPDGANLNTWTSSAKRVSFFSLGAPT